MRSYIIVVLAIFFYGNLLVAQNNYLFAWGNYYTFDYPDAPKGPMPAKNTINGKWIVIAPASMQGYGAGILENGTLMVWRASETAVSSEGVLPVQYGTDTDWASVIAMRDYYILTKKDGTLWKLCYTIVYGCHEQIGADSDWREVGGKGTSKIMGLKENGTLWIINPDDNSFTQYGTDSDWKTIKRGNGYLGIKEDGTLWSTEMPTIPFQYSGPDIHNIKDISYNSQFLVVKEDGTLWAWGWNKKGELGLGYTSQYFEENPIQIGTDNDWSVVSAGIGVSFAIKTNGTLWSWGNGENYILGNQDTQSRLQPTRVMDGGSNDWLDVFAGYYYAMGLRASKDNMNSTTSIISNDDFINFNMYPNPAYSNITLENIPINSEINICDFSGKTVFTKKTVTGNGKLIIDISDFAKGFYLVSVKNKGYNKVEKLVIK